MIEEVLKCLDRKNFQKKIIAEKENVVANGHVVGGILSEFSLIKEVPYGDENSFWRASSIGGLCVVEEVYCSLLKITRFKEIDIADDFRMQIGTAIHRWLLPKIDYLIGTWECFDCKNGSKWSVWKTKCPNCGSTNISYSCDELFDNKHHISGEPDGIGIINSEKEILEVKTTDKPEKLLAKEYFFNYLVQINVYMYLAKLDRARLFVLDRNNPMNYKEYVFLKNEELIGNQLAKVDKIRECIKKKRIPYELKIENCPRRKTCVVGTECSIDGKF